MDYGALTLEHFYTSLESDEPVPGGGTASALAVGMGAGLLRMFMKISLRSKKVPQDEKDICSSWLEQSVTWVQDALSLAQQDAKAFQQVMEAFRLPKETDEEKALRKKKIQEATLGAARVPLQTALLAESVIRGCLALAGKGSAMARSDLETAYQLARAGLVGALENVAINLESLSPEAIPDEIRHEYDRLILFEKNLSHKLH